MISKLIPPQYQMLALAAAFAFVAAGSAAAGWQVNGWRLGKAAAEERVDTLSAAIGKIGEDMTALGNISRGNQEADARAAQAAEEGFDAIKAYLDAQGGGCTLSESDARFLRDNADRRRAARKGG
ncbi:hypothetical protein [Parvibaculum sp.]|uniref:hypothetical protein n=1 Tax=Parvibaculum sp. TaxID=2024848 RepID=UPI001DA68F0C|nr:hypothetical protein [Parvibaculum sp.]MBX3488852.1 hypothetical protein [Parvibaculum sp.]